MATPLKVVLWQDVDKLGKRGEVVRVTPGFARNYLFPRRMASLPTSEKMKELEHEKRRLVKREAREKQAATALATKVEAASCTIEAVANEEGVLFGAITTHMIADAIKKEGVEVDPKLIDIENPIKELGVYEVSVRLHPQVTPKCKVWVVESREGKPPAGDAKAGEATAQAPAGA
ncbi:MAG: 50S ribosomal protein L9 [Planctomycetes bacterium]|nr:50S ribosomal protein L9 [Planctomycetota bacterium]